MNSRENIFEVVWDEEDVDEFYREDVDEFYDVEDVDEVHDDDAIQENSAEEIEAAYEGVRSLLAREYEHLSNDEIAEVMEEVISGMSPEEAENFLKGVGKFLKMAAPVVAKILPVAGGAVGTVVGGPAGTAIGGALGNVLGNLLGQAAGGNKPMPQSPRAPVAAPPQAPGGGPAITTLANFLNNPVFQQVLSGARMGGKGGGKVSIGQPGAQGTTVDLGGMLNALTHLVGLAAKEAAEQAGGEFAEAYPEYLYDENGRLMCDVASPEERANVLLTKLESFKNMEVGRRRL